MLNLFLDGLFPLRLEARVAGPITALVSADLVAIDHPLSMWEIGDDVTRSSNGLGPIAGGRVGLGFWPGAKPFSGFVIRAGYAVHAFEYESTGVSGVLDRTTFTQHRLELTTGKYWLFRSFHVGVDAGVGFELNPARRCFADAGNGTFSESGDCDTGTYEMLVESGTTDLVTPGTQQSIVSPKDLQSGLDPLNVAVSLGLGFAF